MTKSSKFLFAVTTLTATVVGLGVFTLPYSFSQNGPLAYWYFFLALMITLTVILIFGEIAFQEGAVLHLTGYAKKFLGRNWMIAAFLSDYISIILLFVVGGYIVGAKFAPILFPTIDGATAGFSFLLISLIVILLDLKFIERVDLILNTLMLILFFVVSGFSLAHFNINNVINAPVKDTSLTFGIALFAFAGLSAVPALREIIGDNRKMFIKTVLVGYALITFIYLLYTISVLGALGNGVSQDSLSSLSKILPESVIWAAVILAITNIFKTITAVGYYLKKTFISDFNLDPWLSYAAIFIPALIVYIFLPKDFITLIEIIGAFSIGTSALIVLKIYENIKHKKLIHLPNWLVILTALIFLFGIIVTLK